MQVDPARILSAARRQDFSFFLMKVFETLHPGEEPLDLSWYLQAMCHALDEVHSGEARRLVISVPPRHLKSVTATVAFVAWALGHNPAVKIMVATYAESLARLGAEQTRTVLESAWYQRDFPGTRISPRGNRLLELMTTAGGGRRAVSVGGSITGFGADIIILDDCMKADEARSAARREEVRNWLDNTILTRLNNKASGRILSIQQRVHEDDLPAYMLAKGYRHLNLPAIAEREETIALGKGRVHRRKVGDLLNPAREDAAVLEQQRRDMGPANFAAQYQQDPVAPEGNLIRMEWFGTYHTAPERHRFLKVVQSWDTGMTSAPTSDYTVCTTWGFEREERKWYLLDILRERLDYPDLKRAIIRLHARYAADRVVIEKAGSGHSLWGDFRAAGPLRPIMWTPATDKEERFVGCLAEVEAGQFVLPAEAPWLEAFRAELKAFPSGRYDDQVDSFTQFVRFQLRNWPWILTEYLPNGRARGVVRHEKRPW